MDTLTPEKCWTCGDTGSHHYHCPKALTATVVLGEEADEGEIQDEDDFESFQDDSNDMDRPEWDEHFPFGE